MSIEVVHAHAPKLVAVREPYNNGIWLLAEGGVSLLRETGEVARITKGLSLDDILVNRSGRKPVYEGSEIMWSKSGGYRIDHAPAPTIIAVLGAGGLGIFFPAGGGTVYVDGNDSYSNTHTPRETLQDVLDECPERTPIYLGSTITFEV